MPAKQAPSASTERALVIVESPTKASTIRKYLGDGFEVEASVGHIRDLVTRRTELPENDARRSAGWVTYGVNVDNGFEPLEEIYRVSAQKKRQIDTLKHRLDDADALYLATDDDREGEAISWHLLEELRPKVPVRRLVFREITKKAIQQALDHTRDVDMDLVNAQRARRIVDRLYGWDVSQVLWRKIKPGLSAGRVQSVAQRLLVVRERERIAFSSSEYWDLLGHFEAGGQRFDATLHRLGSRRVVSSRDFDATTGIRKDDEGVLLDAATAASLRDRVAKDQGRVVAREVKPLTRRPQAPFTTSTLQQEANRKLRMSAQHAMRVAQSLYEKGLITYMRTDSTRLSDEALSASQATIRDRFGAEMLADGPRVYETKSAGAQEAHEAIRPAGDRFLDPRELGRSFSDQERRLYAMIWQRTVASQMADAQLEQTTLDIAVSAGSDEALFRASGRAVRFAGFLAAWSAETTARQDGDEEQDEQDDDDDRGDEARLPLLREGDAVGYAGVDPTVEAREHHTRPPARLTDASLVKALEEKGIGRPSTYAAIIQNLLDRGYCFRKGSALVPTFMGMAVTHMLERWLPDLVDYDFTAAMEAQLDAIANGEGDCGAYLRGFYREGFHGLGGREVEGLVAQLAAARDQIDPAEASGVRIGELEGTPVDVRIGRYGTFVKAGDRTATVPDDLPPDEMTVEKALELITNKEKGDAPLGELADGTPIFLRNGRYGWYLQAGKSGDGEPKPTMVSLSKGMNPEAVDEALARRQLALPRALGQHPGKKEPIEALVGRYGDYIKMGEETRTLPTGVFAIDVSLEQAAALLDKPRARGGREMIRDIGVRARDGVMISLWTGRWGPYLTDGKNSANLRDENPDNVDLEKAIVLIDKAIEDKAGRLLGKDPESEAEIRVMRGPFGHYLTNGAMNASLPRGTEPEEVDLTFALVRLAEYGKPVKKKGGRKGKAAGAKAEAKPAAKKPAAKKPAAKKPAAKKPAAKKPAAK
ncbi:MAG: type I DNA topoisomerase [Deltaproteobacteria bacterium]|nr:type I DNA topoisomerase [Deltaproteobacteria bacterium]